MKCCIDWRIMVKYKFWKEYWQEVTCYESEQVFMTGIMVAMSCLTVGKWATSIDTCVDRRIRKAEETQQLLSLMCILVVECKILQFIELFVAYKVMCLACNKHVSSVWMNSFKEYFLLNFVDITQNLVSDRCKSSEIIF